MYIWKRLNNSFYYIFLRLCYVSVSNKVGAANFLNLNQESLHRMEYIFQNK